MLLSLEVFNILNMGGRILFNSQAVRSIVVERICAASYQPWTRLSSLPGHLWLLCFLECGKQSRVPCEHATCFCSLMWLFIDCSCQILWVRIPASLRLSPLLLYLASLREDVTDWGASPLGHLVWGLSFLESWAQLGLPTRVSPGHGAWQSAESAVWRASQRQAEMSCSVPFASCGLPVRPSDHPRSMLRWKGQLWIAFGKCSWIIESTHTIHKMYSYLIKGTYWVGDTSLQELSSPTVTGCLLKTENLIVVSLWNQMAQKLQTGARGWHFLESWLCWVHTEKLKMLEFNVCGWWLQTYSCLERTVPVRTSFLF